MISDDEELASTPSVKKPQEVLIISDDETEPVSTLKRPPEAITIPDDEPAPPVVDHEKEKQTLEFEIASLKKVCFFWPFLVCGVFKYISVSLAFAKF